MNNIMTFCFVYHSEALGAGSVDMVSINHARDKAKKEVEMYLHSKGHHAALLPIAHV